MYKEEFKVGELAKMLNMKLKVKAVQDMLANGSDLYGFMYGPWEEELP